MSSSTTTINVSNSTINAANLTGGLTVNGNNNTISNSRITCNGGFVCVQLNGYGNRFVNDTIAGTNSTSGAVQYAIRDFADPPAGGSANSLTNDYVHFCTQCVYSSLTAITNSFVDVDATIAGTHYEAIYNPGGGAGMNIQHSTIGNEHNDQTAAYYSAPDNGQISGVTINDSLLYGGGYAIYPTGQVGQPVLNEVFTNNVIDLSKTQYGWLYTNPKGLHCSSNVTSTGATLGC